MTNARRYMQVLAPKTAHSVRNLPLGIFSAHIFIFAALVTFSYQNSYQTMLHLKVLHFFLTNSFIRLSRSKYWDIYGDGICKSQLRQSWIQRTSEAILDACSVLFLRHAHIKFEHGSQ